MKDNIPNWLLKTIKFKNNNYYCHICNELITVDNINKNTLKCNNNSLHLLYSNNILIFQIFINNKKISNILDINKKTITSLYIDGNLNFKFETQSFSFQWVEDKIKNSILI